MKPSDLAKGKNPASNAARGYCLFTSKKMESVTNKALSGSVKDDTVLSKNTGLTKVSKKAINAKLGIVFWAIL